jgi:hypothetical protein
MSFESELRDICDPREYLGGDNTCKRCPLTNCDACASADFCFRCSVPRYTWDTLAKQCIQ